MKKIKLLNGEEIELNQAFNMDCWEFMMGLPNNCIDLTVTSPPYDNLRTYNNSLVWNELIWSNILIELYRITNNGGVVVWVVNDATINGSETGTSFKQALFAMKCGFNLHDTMIWNKPNAMPQIDKSRYCQSFEYMFILSKGKPKTTNLIKIPTKNAGKTIIRKTIQTENINKMERTDKTKSDRIAFNVYNLNVGGKKEAEHPAIYPKKLAEDHILTWSNEGDIVFDPFCGSFTTAITAIKNNRNWFGCELSKEFYKSGYHRYEQETKQQLFEF